MRIAICDKDEKFLYKIKNIIYRYAEEHRLDVVADCFMSGESVLARGNYYSLIFLGYRLLGENGLKIAENLRACKVNSAIIFISDCTDFIFEAFKVSAYRFLLKSGYETEVWSVLDDFFYGIQCDYPLLVKSDDDVVCVNTRDIYFLEANNKHCYIHLKNEVLNCKRTMARVYDAMPKSHFSKTNRAFVVNLRHISRYNNDVITLKNGEALHPSRNYYQTFKDEYRRFLRPYEL